MAKESGLGNALYVGGFDLSGEAHNWAVGGGPAMIDQTTIRETAFERIGGMLSGAVKYQSYFDPLSATHVHESALPRGDEIGMLCHREALGQPAACWTAKQLNYDPTRDQAGAIDFKIDAQSTADGIEWCMLLTAGKRTDVAATNGAGVDHGFVPPGSFGLQAYLQVFAVSGGTPTVKLQGSSDDGAGDPYADIVGGSFGAINAVGAYRIETSRTQAIERYCRVVTTGAMTSLTFAVAVMINDVAVAL